MMGRMKFSFNFPHADNKASNLVLLTVRRFTVMKNDKLEFDHKP